MTCQTNQPPVTSHNQVMARFYRAEAAWKQAYAAYRDHPEEDGQLAAYDLAEAAYRALMAAPAYTLEQLATKARACREWTLAGEKVGPGEVSPVLDDIARLEEAHEREFFGPWRRIDNAVCDLLAVAEALEIVIESMDSMEASKHLPMRATHDLTSRVSRLSKELLEALNDRDTIKVA